MTLRSELGLDEHPDQQQPIPVVRVCWDDLFAFLQKLLRPKTAKAWTALGNLHAETSTNYKQVFKAEVETDFEGILEEISLYSSRPDTTDWFLVIAGVPQFSDKKIYNSLTLPYGGLLIHTAQIVELFAKTTDGLATNIAGTLSGRLRYLAV